MARQFSTNATPRDNAYLAGLFGTDFSPAEGTIGGSKLDLFRTAQRVVEHSGITTLIEQWSTLERDGRRPGPTPWLSEVQVMALMLTLTLSRRAPLFTEMQRLLRESDPRSLAVLDIAVPDGLSDIALYHRAYNSYRRLVRLMDPEPGSLYQTLTKAEVSERLAARDMEKSRIHRNRAHAFGNALLRGTWMLLPREVRRKFNGDIAVDATITKAPARGRGRNSDWASSDPEAGWYKRDGNHDGGTSRAATKYQRRSDALIWGRELHTAVTHGKDVPVIVLSATLDVPGKRLAENALACVDALRSEGVAPGHFVSDRAYLPGCKSGDLALPLRARGYSLVFDYDRTQTALGVQASHAGAILVEGRWYCPDMPEPLRNATIDFFLREADDPARISTQAYEERIKRREHYALRPKQRPDAEGFARYQHPPGYRHAPRKGHPTPQACSQATVTIPPSAGAKYEQTYPYRSEHWGQQYTSGRQCVESMNKSIKDGKFMPVDDAEMRPRRGWIAQLLSIVGMVAATNVRKIIDWLHAQVGISRLSSAPVRRARRREITKGWTAVPNAPPAVAARA